MRFLRRPKQVEPAITAPARPTQPEARPQVAEERPTAENKAEVSNVSVIGPQMAFANATFEGKTTDIEVHGQVTDTRMHVRKLTVAEGASVSGEITCVTLVIRGRVQGTIQASDVAIHKSAEVIGSLAYEKLAMSVGSRVSAQLVCKLMKDEASGEGLLDAILTPRPIGPTAVPVQSLNDEQRPPASITFAQGFSSGGGFLREQVG